MTHAPLEMETATFAGGCFWCVASDFLKKEGVIKALSGYTGGETDTPSYESVSRGETDHLEAVQICYDPRKTDYRSLVEHFFRHIDPTDPGGQFADRGEHYRTAIFYHDERQKKIAQEVKAALERSERFKKPLATEIRAYSRFYPAEAYHQNFHEKNTLRYTLYRTGSGRDGFLKRHWGKADKEKSAPSGTAGFERPSEEALKKRLTPLQYHVVRKNGTEKPFDNSYWNTHEEGLYVDIVSGEPLFSSLDKFDSGTGWPSFTKPLKPDALVENTDRSLFMERTEVRSRMADSHLGHLFSDGPPPSGLRYCINSAALRFVPKEALEQEGYGSYAKLFQD